MVSPSGSISSGVGTMDEFLGTSYGQSWLQANREAAGYQREVLAEQIKARAETNKLRAKEIAVREGEAKANAWYQREQTKLGWAAQRLDEEIQRGRLSLDQSKLGLDYLMADAEFRSTPDNYFKLMDFQAGASQRQDVPIFLQRLVENTTGAQSPQNPGQPAPGGTPTAGSAQQAIAALTGQAQPSGGGGGESAPKSTDPRLAAILAAVKAAPPSGTDGWNDQDKTALGVIQSLYQQGFGSLGPQALESAGKTGRALLAAGGKRLGYDPSMAFEDYVNSRYQGSSGRAFGAA